MRLSYVDARIVRAIDVGDPAVSGNWASADRPVHPSAGVYPYRVADRYGNGVTLR
jgi:hypothetical protein